MICVYNIYKCLVNINRIPFLVEEKSNLPTKFLYKTNYVNNILGHYVKYGMPTLASKEHWGIISHL